MDLQFNPTIVGRETPGSGIQRAFLEVFVQPCLFLLVQTKTTVRKYLHSPQIDPQLVQIVPPNEVVVLISFDVALGEIRGMVNLCIPYNSIERISSKLSANSWVAYGHREATPDSIRQVSRQLQNALVELRVRLAQSRITTGDLIGLRVGDIITTEKDMRSPLVVTVEGAPKFRASCGSFKARKAIRIEEIITEQSALPGD